MQIRLFAANLSAFPTQDLFWKRGGSIFQIWGAPGRRFGKLENHFGAIFGVQGLHFGSFRAPQTALVGIKQSIKNSIIFWIVFLSILEPSWRPKWFPNPPKIAPKINLERSWGGLGAPKPSKRAPELPGPLPRGPRDHFLTICHRCCIDF